MMLLIYILILLGSLFVLGKSAHYVTIAITRIGHTLGISEFITGFVILGIATSFPEMFVGIQSAFSGTPQLSLGNLFGANIVLLTLIAGTACLMNRGINLKSELSHYGRLIQIIVLIVSPLVVLLDSYLSRWDAVFLVLMFAGYMFYLIKKAPRDSPPLQEHLMNHKFFHIIFLSIAGFVGLILASKVVVYASLQIAQMFTIPPVLVGVLMLSIGTNLPEISVVLAAIKKHHTNLVIGDILGSAATNTFVVALVGLIAPFRIVEAKILQSTSVFMIVALALFFWFTKSKNRLSVPEAIILIAFYISFVASQFFFLGH